MTIKALFPTVRPSLNLDFAKTKALDPRITFTRASTGTFVGSDGLIQTAASGAARFDHNPTTGESLGLLVEEARTNLLTYSEQFNDASWLKTFPPVNSNVFVAPDGTITADEIIPESNGVYVSKGVTLTATIYSGSIYVRAGTATSFTFYLATSGLGLGASCIFNLSNGTASSVTHYGSSSNFTASIQALPGNWYRCSIAGSCTATTWYHQVGIFSNQSNNIYVWGAQLEAGSFPTSYIPTTSATVTRAADVATVSNTNSSIFPTSAFTTINSPFGTAVGGTSLKLIGPTIKRTAVYAGNLPQNQINALTNTADFWRWRVLGSSFALPNFTTDGSVTVDWGDGVVETLTTGVHTFTNGSGYHDIGFRLNSGTFFKPNINDNATYKTRVIAVGPAPASMKVDAAFGFYGCSALRLLDATLDPTGSTDLQLAWQGCTSLTSFPLINTAAGTNFQQAWYGCTNLATFPANMFNTTGTLVATAFSNTFFGCALTATSIENILTSLVTNGQSNITLGLSGGTNAGAATWTANAVTAYNTLISRGWTITRNA